MPFIPITVPWELQALLYASLAAFLVIAAFLFLTDWGGGDDWKP